MSRPSIRWCGVPRGPGTGEAGAQAWVRARRRGGEYGTGTGDGRGLDGILRPGSVTARAVLAILAPTAFIAALISFTYHLPPCSSPTVTRWAIWSFVTPAEACSGSCRITVTVICRAAPPGGTCRPAIESKATAPPSPVSDTPRTSKWASAVLSPLA